MGWFSCSYLFFACYFSAHVLSEDTTYRQVRDGKLYTKRLLTKTNKVPKWGERFISTKTVKILEESICDPQTKTLTTYTRNLGMQSIMVSHSSSFEEFWCKTPFVRWILHSLSNGPLGLESSKFSDIWVQ